MFSIEKFNSKKELLEARDTLREWVANEFGAKDMSNKVLDAKFARLFNYKDFNTLLGELEKRVDEMKPCTPPMGSSSHTSVYITADRHVDMFNPRHPITCLSSLDGSKNAVEFEAQAYFVHLNANGELKKVLLALLGLEGDEHCARDNIAHFLTSVEPQPEGVGISSLKTMMDMDAEVQYGFEVYVDMDKLLEWVAHNNYPVFHAVMLQQIEDGGVCTDSMRVRLECAEGCEAVSLRSKGKETDELYNHLVAHTTDAIITSDTAQEVVLDGDYWRDIDGTDNGVDILYLAVAEHECDVEEIIEAMVNQEEPVAVNENLLKAAKAYKDFSQK